MDQADSAAALYAARLHALINAAGLTNRAAADGINARAGHQIVSHSNLSMMRNGQRNMPSYNRLVAIAKFFGVSTEYFTDPHPHDGGELERARDQIRAQTARPILDRLDGLPASWTTVITDMLDQAREAHGLPPVLSPSETPADEPSKSSDHD